MNLRQLLKCFWWEHLVILLLLNLAGGCDKLIETNLWEKIISFPCLLWWGLNCIFHWLFYKPVDLSFLCQYWFLLQIYLCLELLKKEMPQQQKLYTLVLFHRVDHLYKSEWKRSLWNTRINFSPLRCWTIWNNSLFTILEIVIK